jgi:2-amino-4-hydroxy-6-hydroxymethyldihydropteridine diphosphokinase
MRTAYIGLGANLPSPAGPPEATLAAATVRLATLGEVSARSSLYSTAPVGYADQPRFLNAVVALSTNFAPHVLLDNLLSIEREFGRNRSAGIPNGPRTLDLDILMMGDLHLSEAGLQIPHPRLAERAFVLIPLNEIASQAVDPRGCKTVAQLLHDLLERRKDETDAVVQFQSDAWSAGAGRSAAQLSNPAANRSHR